MHLKESLGKPALPGHSCTGLNLHVGCVESAARVCMQGKGRVEHVLHAALRLGGFSKPLTVVLPRGVRTGGRHARPVPRGAVHSARRLCGTGRLRQASQMQACAATRGVERLVRAPQDPQHNTQPSVLGAWGSRQGWRPARFCWPAGVSSKPCLETEK